MATSGTNSRAVHVGGEDDHLPQKHLSHMDQDLDAGALFVLKSKGSWMHCGYHLTTSIVAPSLLSLPFAFTFLGWAAGIMCLFVGALVTFYSYNLLSLVLEHHAQLGRRHLRFRDMANDILGPRWGRYFVVPIQFTVCYGTVIAFTLLGGQCMKAIYLLSEPNGTMKLYEFVIIFGILMLILAQIPSFHSLRHINLISLFLCLAYSACASAASISIGNSSKGPKKDYSLKGGTENQVFGIFNAIAIIATTYGNGIIPEIQATIAPPVKGKMFKGLCVCYTVLIATFFTVAISGYWAFGNESQGLLLSNFLDDGKPLVPKWFILMTNLFAILQLSAVAVVYLQPTNEALERTFADPKSKQFSARNVIPRLVSRSLSVVISTTVAAMLPFFGDINAVVGAFGFMPLDFVLPAVFFNLTFKPSKQSLIFWLNVTIAVVFSALGVIAAIAAVRYLDLHVTWNDLVRPDHNISDGKGSESEASVFRNAITCDKKTVQRKIQYGVAFGNQKHLPSRVMKNIIDTERTEDGKEKCWFHSTYIPLYLIKEYEERMSVAVLPSVKKPSTQLSDLQRRQLKASRRNVFAYLIRKVLLCFV